MFVNETHSYFIMISINAPEGAPVDYLQKQLNYITDAVQHLGGERVGNLKFTWMLNNVMYAQSEDIYKMISKETNRVVANDSSLSAEEKVLFSIEPREHDRIIVTEYIAGTTFIPS